MRVVGLVGLKGAGKTTVADIFKKQDYVPVSYAKRLKDMVQELTGLERKYFYDPKLKEQPLPQWNNVTPRKLLQHVGTEGFRALDPDFWVKVLFNSLDSFGRYILDDLRFENEIQPIFERGGTVALVRMSNMTELDIEQFDDHESERLAREWTMQSLSMPPSRKTMKTKFGKVPVIKLQSGKPEMNAEVVKRALPEYFV